MRFSVILTGTFAAVAMAQATPAPSASSGTPTTASAPTSVGMTPQQSSALACLDRCRADDVNCRAACNGVSWTLGKEFEGRKSPLYVNKNPMLTHFSHIGSFPQRRTGQLDHHLRG